MDQLDKVVKATVELLGFSKKDLLPSIGSPKKVPFYKLYKKAKPGDHIAVYYYTTGYWHHGIYFGKENGKEYVIDNHPDFNVSKRPLEDFLKLATDGVVISYDEAFPREVSLGIAQAACSTTSIVYDPLSCNCEIFALFCRTGRYERTNMCQPTPFKHKSLAGKLQSKS